MPNPEPMASSKRRRPLRPAIQEKKKPPEEPKEEEAFKSVASIIGYESVEVAANALITALIQQIEGEPDLAHTGAIRQAVQLLYNIGTKPTKIKSYKELHKLLDTLEQYHRTA